MGVSKWILLGLVVLLLAAMMASWGGALVWFVNNNQVVYCGQRPSPPPPEQNAYLNDQALEEMRRVEQVKVEAYNQCVTDNTLDWAQKTIHWAQPVMIAGIVIFLVSLASVGFQAYRERSKR